MNGTLGSRQTLLACCASLALATIAVGQDAPPPADAKRIERLIDELAAESLEVRDRAQAELLKIGAPAYPHLKRAAEGSDAERRGRIAGLLRHPVFLAVPEVLEANLRSLALADRDRWHAALREVLTAGDVAVATLRKSAGAKDALLSFRAAQVADILESKPTKGLRFGIVVERPDAKLEGSLPGVEIFINTSGKTMVIETAVDTIVKVEGGGREDFTGWPARRGRLVTIEPGAVHVKARENLLRGIDATGYVSGSCAIEVGCAKVTGDYAFEKEGAGCWTGKIPGNVVTVEFTK